MLLCVDNDFKHVSVVCCVLVWLGFGVGVCYSTSSIVTDNVCRWFQ